MKIHAMVGGQPHEVLVKRTNGTFEVQVGDETYIVDALKLEQDFYSIITDNRSYEVSVEPQHDGYAVRHGASIKHVIFADPSRSARDAAHAADGPEEVITQMPGKVVRVLVGEGDEVEAGQGVVVVEAMKMENEISVNKGGKVVSVEVAPGQTVEGGAVLLVVE